MDAIETDALAPRRARPCAFRADECNRPAAFPATAFYLVALPYALLPPPSHAEPALALGAFGMAFGLTLDFIIACTSLSMKYP